MRVRTRMTQLLRQLRRYPAKGLFIVICILMAAITLWAFLQPASPKAPVSPAASPGKTVAATENAAPISITIILATPIVPGSGSQVAIPSPETTSTLSTPSTPTRTVSPTSAKTASTTATSTATPTATITPTNFNQLATAANDTGKHLDDLSTALTAFGLALLKIMAVILIVLLFFVILWEFLHRLFLSPSIVMKDFANASGNEKFDKRLGGLSQLGREMLARRFVLDRSKVTLYIQAIGPKQYQVKDSESEYPKAEESDQLVELLNALKEIAPASVKPALPLLKQALPTNQNQITVNGWLQMTEGKGAIPGITFEVSGGKGLMPTSYTVWERDASPDESAGDKKPPQTNPLISLLNFAGARLKAIVGKLFTRQAQKVCGEKSTKAAIHTEATPSIPTDDTPGGDTPVPGGDKGDKGKVQGKTKAQVPDKEDVTGRYKTLLETGIKWLGGELLRRRMLTDDNARSKEPKCQYDAQVETFIAQLYTSYAKKYDPFVDASISHLEQAIRLDPDYFKAYKYLAYNYGDRAMKQQREGTEANWQENQRKALYYYGIATHKLEDNTSSKDGIKKGSLEYRLARAEIAVGTALTKLRSQDTSLIGTVVTDMREAEELCVLPHEGEIDYPVDRHTLLYNLAAVFAHAYKQITASSDFKRSAGRYLAYALVRSTAYNFDLWRAIDNDKDGDKDFINVITAEELQRLKNAITDLVVHNTKLPTEHGSDFTGPIDKKVDDIFR